MINNKTIYNVSFVIDSDFQRISHTKHLPDGSCLTEIDSKVYFLLKKQYICSSPYLSLKSKRVIYPLVKFVITIYKRKTFF